MGAYLSTPDTEKHSINENLKRLSYGASSMQGWRATQEDAHNCIPDFDDNISMFAVYDGHGGAEVAQYCAMRFPDHIKSVGAYKTGNLAQALEDSFLGFDELLTRPEVIKELKVLSGISDNPSDTENEVDHLFAEANMPLDEVLAKYGNDGPPQLLESATNPALARVKDSKPLSPFLRAKSNAAKGDGSIGDHIKIGFEEEESEKKEVVNGETETDDEKKTINGEVEDTTKEQIKDVDKGEEEKTINRQSGDDETVKDKSEQNKNSVSSEGSPSSATSALKELSPPKLEQAGCSSSSGKRLTKKIVTVTVDSSSDSSSEEDETYEENIIFADSSDSDEDEFGLEKEADDSDDDDSNEDDDEDDEETDEISESETEEPGSDSGCTAVVALLRGDSLYVANAGDSRCIVCRGGKAIDMSVDHKPEDELEKKRIVAAGGTVTCDGRVDGGLNLSRAIGDHTYKQNKDIPAKDQMISALPDIRTLTIDPAEDEFMVLACDGIWNSMSSQEVADFVQERLRDGVENMASICEAMFERCLATNTRGDGTGCDNMTCIIVQFHKGLANAMADTKKRENSESLESSAKRQKSDTGDDDTTTATITTTIQ